MKEKKGEGKREGRKAAGVENEWKGIDEATKRLHEGMDGSGKGKEVSEVGTEKLGGGKRMERRRIGKEEAVRGTYGRAKGGEGCKEEGR